MSISGVFQETELTSRIHEMATEGCSVLARAAENKHQGGVAVFDQNLGVIDRGVRRIQPKPHDLPDHG